MLQTSQLFLKLTNLYSYFKEDLMHLDYKLISIINILMKSYFKIFFKIVNLKVILIFSSIVEMLNFFLFFFITTAI